MTKNIPVVDNGSFVNVGPPRRIIYVDSPAWFAWLEAPATTRFSFAIFNRKEGYIDGFMTVRKEQRQRGGAYWTVYRRQHKHLYKIYVGPSTLLTLALLEQIATRLHVVPHADQQTVTGTASPHVPPEVKP